MNTSTMRTRIFKNKVSKIVLAIALASVTGGLTMAPAFADDNRGSYHRHHHHHTYYAQPGYYPYYEQPVYAPPPVYYAPEPSPGINLFFPIHIH